MTPSPPKLHLDEDASDKRLYHALLERQHDVTWTPNVWMPKAGSDREQLIGAMARGRILFSFNIKDFVALATVYPEHRGIVLAARSSWTLSSLIQALDRLLTETNSNEWLGQTRYLGHWQKINDQSKRSFACVLGLLPR